MTEEDWLRCNDPKPMLEFLKGRASDRKLRLFGCACVRRVWRGLPPGAQDAAVVAADYLDGRATQANVVYARFQALFAHCVIEEKWVAAVDEWDRRREQNMTRRQREEEFELAKHGLGPASMPATPAEEVVARYGAEAVEWLALAMLDPEPWSSVREVFDNVAKAIRPYPAAARSAELAAQAARLRDIVRDPHERPTRLAFPPGLAAVELAQTIYDRRAFDRMPELAEVLERTGCTDAEVLRHCRAAQAHVRGCWVVDLVLGKA